MYIKLQHSVLAIIVSVTYSAEHSKILTFNIPLMKCELYVNRSEGGL